MGSKKADLLVPSALMRLILALFLFLGVVYVGLKASEGFFSSNAPKHLNKFVEEINEMDADATKDLLFQLEPDTAVFGFSKDAKETICKGCFSLDTRDVDITKSFIVSKPPNSECKDKACVCVCTTDVKETPRNEYENILECEKVYCGELIGSDIKSEITMNAALADKKEIKIYPVMVNGFIFRRHSAEPAGQSPLSTKERNTQVCATKLAYDNNIFTAIYPGTDCAFLRQSNLNS